MPVSRKLLTLSLVGLALFATGCGSSSSSSSSSPSGTSSATSSAASGATTPDVGHLPTAKFALHAGLAFGAFHRYIYKPLKSGTFSGGVLKHKAALVKAGLAGLFVYHELKIAIKDAEASPTLSKLVAPVTALADKAKSIGESAKGGNFDHSSITSASQDITSLTGQAKQAGIPISSHEPSLAALAGGG